MTLFDDFCEYLSSITTINKDMVQSIILTLIIVLVFGIIKWIKKKVIKNKLINSRGEFIINQSFQTLINILEYIILFVIWSKFFSDLMTLISVVSAAMTIALREVILNFFCGIYIRIKRPFRVEDRIQIEDFKGDVINISSLSFEILEVSNKEENGQSTGVIITYPNSIVFSKPIKNINKGFKYIWSELVVNISYDGDLANSKKEIYKIISGIETIKSIPLKMEKEIKEISSDNRIYYNNYEPIIYTKLVDDHIELTVRYLMHPKKARYVESVIWNKIYLAFRDGRINLYTGDKEFKFNEE